MWRRLDRYMAGDISRDKYLQLCEQLNRDPDPEKLPPELDDFPDDIQKALIVFNQLGDRIAPDIGYLGKDMSGINAFIEAYEVSDTKIFLEAVVRLDQKVIEESQKKLKAERDKIKRKAKQS